MKTMLLRGSLFFALAGVLAAQTVVTGPSPQTAIVPVAWGPTAQYPQDQTSAFQESLPRPPGLQSLWQWGPVGLSPEATYELLYTEGILVGPGHAVSTTLQTFSPGVFFRFGSNWTLDYSPTWDVYSNALFHNTVDHSVRLDGRAVYEDWTFRLEQSYARTSDPLVETARQTPEQFYATALTASYGYGDRTRLELGLDQDIRLSSAVPEFYEWSSQDWLYFRLSPQLDAAVGPGAGYIIVDPGVDMTYFRPEGRLTWQALEKLRLDVQGGFENRHFIGTGSRNLVTPVYSAGAIYQVTETTQLTADADRDVEVGYSLNQVVEVQRYTFGFRQRLLQHFYFGASAGWENSDYLGVGGPRVAIRHDRGDTYQLSLGTLLLNHINASLQYSNIHNRSDVPGFGIQSDQYGLVLGYKY